MMSHAKAAAAALEASLFSCVCRRCILNKVKKTERHTAQHTLGFYSYQNLSLILNMQERERVIEEEKKKNDRKKIFMNAIRVHRALWMSC